MNKRILLSIMFVGILASVDAQIAKWLVRPNYDYIEMLDCGLMKTFMSGKIGLLNDTGTEILPLKYDSITTFKEGCALLFNNNAFCAVVNMQGHVTDVADRHYIVSKNNQFYSFGYLLVKKGNQYFFIDPEGVEAYGPFAEAYPFFDGIARVKSYVNVQKNVEDTYYEYIKAGEGPVFLPETDKGDINFLSSFHNGKAIAVVKKRFYNIDAASYEMTPLSVDSTLNKKSLVVAPEKKIVPLINEGNYMVTAKNGIFTFDTYMRLARMELLENEPQNYPFKQEVAKKHPSSFSIIANNNIFGLDYKGQNILPPQFEKVISLKDELAIVKSDKKCGVITVDNKNHIRFKLNNNEHIGFTHQYYETMLAVMLPSYIKCSSAVVASKSSDCEIQIETRTENENVEGNTLGYKCRLSIPQDLADTLMTHSYRYALKYDGLTSVDYIVSIPEWYVKYYEVELKNTSLSLNPTDSVNVEFDLIKTDVARNDESNYYKEVELVSLNYEGELTLNKITENHYSFRLSGIDQERIMFSVKITERGCPSIEYPFEMVFVKPKPREKNKKTTVTISAVRKKQPDKTIFIPE